MSDLASVRKYLTVEELWAFAAGTVSLAQAFGEVCNWVQDNVSLTPIGSVVESMLTETQFQADMGVGWVLLDGRDVTGSSYHSITGNANIPPGRGRFLRGKKNGRSDGKGEPSELTLGSVQSDENDEHNHSLSITNNCAKWSGFYDVEQNEYLLPQYLTIGVNPSVTVENVASGLGGAEMRPAETIENFFIRIN